MSQGIVQSEILNYNSYSNGIVLLVDSDLIEDEEGEEEGRRRRRTTKTTNNDNMKNKQSTVPWVCLRGKRSYEVLVTSVFLAQHI